MTLKRRQHAQGFDRITSLTNVCFECVLELNQQKPQIICFENVKLTLNEDFLLLFLLPFTLSTILVRIVQHILKNSDLRMERLMQPALQLILPESF